MTHNKAYAAMQVHDCGCTSLVTPVIDLSLDTPMPNACRAIIT